MTYGGPGARTRRLRHVRQCLVLDEPARAAASSAAARRAPAGRAPARRLQPGCAPAPGRTDDPAEALRLVQRDGYAVLTPPPTMPCGLAVGQMDAEAVRDYAAALPLAVFGSRLSQNKPPERVAGGGWDGREWRGHRVAGPDRGHLPNTPHMDTAPWGDLRSDYFMMVFAELPEAGGDSYFVDGLSLLHSLPPSVQRAFAAVPTQNRGSLGHNVRGGRSGGNLWRSAGLQQTAAGRAVLRAPNGGHTTNLPDVDEPVADRGPAVRAAGEERIRVWREAVVAAAGHGPQAFCRQTHTQLPSRKRGC